MTLDQLDRLKTELPDGVRTFLEQKISEETADQIGPFINSTEEATQFLDQFDSDEFQSVDEEPSEPIPKINQKGIPLQLIREGQYLHRESNLYFEVDDDHLVCTGSYNDEVISPLTGEQIPYRK